MRLVKPVLIVLFALYLSDAKSQVLGGRDNSEISPTVSEPTKLSGGGFVGDVNVMTGVYNASIPLGTVSTPAGPSFSLVLNHSSSFSFSSSQPTTAGIPYGDGWSPNIPTISVDDDVFHKFTCNQMTNDSYTSSSPSGAQLNFNNTSDNPYVGEDEADLFWFAPEISIPGVASGRAIFKYVDQDDDNCVVFALNTFESPVEIRFYGNEWSVIAADGTRYDFRTRAMNYRAPSNQRVIHYDQDASQLPDAQTSVVNSDTYGTYTETVQNAIEPKLAVNVWYCDKISNLNAPKQCVVFKYKYFGAFDYFKEFKQTRYNIVRTNVLNLPLYIPQVVYKDVILDEIHSAVWDTKVDILKLDYRTLTAAVDNDLILHQDHPNNIFIDSMYTAEIAHEWHHDGVGSISGTSDDFDQWKRYKHGAHPDYPSVSAVNSVNPYIHQDGYYHRENGPASGEIPFDHGFLESNRILDNQKVYPGDIYELQTKITRQNQYDVHDGNGTIDLAVVSGTCGNNANSQTNSFQDGGNTIDPTFYNKYRNVELFSTFNTALKWQMGKGQSLITTSNLFVMPNLPTTYHGFNIQVGPGNSDMDFGATTGSNSYLIEDITTSPTFNAKAAYPTSQNSRPIPSTANIPHNFGTGHPWAMMVPIFNVMAAVDPSNTTAMDAFEHFYEEWWQNDPLLTSYGLENKPTKFNDAVKLEDVVLLRYSKNAYMLQGVRLYHLNGEISENGTSNSGWHLAAQKRLEYSYKDETLRRNYQMSNGSPVHDESLYQRRIFLLEKVVDVSLESTDLFAANYGMVAPETAPTTYFTYEKFIDPSGVWGTYDESKPYLGLKQYLISSVTDHLGGTTFIEYYDMSFSNYGPSRIADGHTFNACASPISNIGRGDTYTIHAAVHTIAKADEAVFSTPFPYFGAKVWEYEYDITKRIMKPKKYNLPENFFRQRNVSRSESGFGKVTVYSPSVDGSGRNRTVYEYYGKSYDPATATQGTSAYNTPATLEEYLYYGKLKSIKNYNAAGILEDEKICNYSHTKAYINGYKRPNPIKNNMNFDLVISTYEYEDIYENEPLEVPIPGGNGAIASGTAAYTYINSPRLKGNYGNEEHPKLMEFYFYNELVAHPNNRAYYFDSYFIKKTEEISRAYEDGLSISGTGGGGTNPPVVGNGKPNNPHGSGWVNPKPADPRTDGDLIGLIDENFPTLMDDLIANSPLSDDVLNHMVPSAMRSDEKAQVLVIQQGLSNEVWETVLNNFEAFAPQDMEQIIAAQPYFSDPTQHYLIQHLDRTTNDANYGQMFVNNTYITDSVTKSLNASTNIPGDNYATILQGQPQYSEQIITEMVASFNMNNNNLARILKNQYVSDDRYFQMNGDARFGEDAIIDLVEQGTTYPSDSVLMAMLNRTPSLTATNAQRLLAAADRPIGQEVLSLIDQIYPPAIAIDIKPAQSLFYNPLSEYCGNAVNTDRTYIETKTEYEYYEADYTGKAVGKAYEMLQGHISSMNEPSAFPKTIVVANYSSLASSGITGNSVYVDGLYLKHEPSWQVFAVKTSSPHMPEAYNREEYYYLFDLQNRYDRHWQNYDLANGNYQFIPWNSTAGEPIVWINNNWDVEYNTMTPSIPKFDGMERTRRNGIRNLAFQKSTISKNARDEQPINRSEYYHYVARWNFDDFPEPTIVLEDNTLPCNSGTPDPGCSSIETCDDCPIPFFKPLIMEYADVTPFGYALWFYNGTYYLCPVGHDWTSIGADLLFSDDGGVVPPQGGGNKMATFASVLQKALMLRDVTVQIDTLVTDRQLDFTTYKVDQKNNYVADFLMGPTADVDAENFPAPYEMLYPYDVLTVRKITERNRYMQPELEENQIGLQTKYYYNNSQSYKAVNSSCTYYTSHEYTELYHIGLPTQIAVGYGRPDALNTYYEYNDFGMVTKVTDPTGKFMEYEFYDDYLRLKRISENGSRRLSDFEYKSWEHDVALSFAERTNQNFVQTTLYNSSPTDPSNAVQYDYEIRKAFVDPLARNHSVVAAYYLSDGFIQQIHSGTVHYDRLDRTMKSHKNHTIVAPVIDMAYPDPSLNPHPYSESAFEDSPKSRVLRAANFGVNLANNEVVKMNYAIANDVYTSCELALNFYELKLIMPEGNTQNCRFMRSEIIDQDDKRSVEYTNAIGQKVATLKYNDSDQKIVTLFVYDSYGNLIKTINPEKQHSNYEYNILGQLVRENTVDAGEKRYMYNVQGLVSVVQDEVARTKTDIAGNATPFYRVFQYDDYGRLMKVGRHTTNFDYMHSDEYSPLHYRTESLNGGFTGEPVGGDYSANGLYFDYQYTNASTQDWLVSFIAWDYMAVPNPHYEALLQTGFDGQFIGSTLEKEYFYGLTPSISKTGKLIQTVSYNAGGMATQRVVLDYDTYGNIKDQKVYFNADNDVNANVGNKISHIVYPAYNYRNALLQQRIDVDNDGSVDLQCFMEYDKLNRLVAIRAATALVSSSASATLLVSYEHDDANGLILKKKHYVDNAGVDALVNEIEYSYDVRDRLTDIKAGKLSAGLNPLMHYQLLYDDQAPSYVNGTGLETVNYSSNYNGNINGSLMRYDFNDISVQNPPSAGTFAKPTLYGYIYDKINRLITADATVGDMVVTGSAQEYEIGNVDVTYDRIGNITTLTRNLRGNGLVGAPDYMEEQQYSYVYATGNNRLEQVTGIGTTPTRMYTYDANGNLLSDDFRNIVGTTYGRAAYAYQLQMTGGDQHDYLYSIDDQRIYKKVEENGVVVSEEYYLHDAMGKTIAIGDLLSGNWEFFISGSERECKIPGQAGATIGANDATFYIYDHLGNTRITYTPVVGTSYDLIMSNEFTGSTNGWTANNVTLNNLSDKLHVTTTPSVSYCAASKTVVPALITGDNYQITVDVTMDSPTNDLHLYVGGVDLGGLVDGSNTFNFTHTVAFSTLDVVLENSASYTQSYAYELDNIRVYHQVNGLITHLENVMDYFPYGKVLRKYVTGDEERYLTTQHERDEETGLDYRGARYYDCDVARFLSLDPHAVDYPSWSDYNYVADNPIIFVDSDGKDVIIYGSDGTHLATYSKGKTTYYNGGASSNIVVEYEASRNYTNPHSSLLEDIENSDGVLEIHETFEPLGGGSFQPDPSSLQFNDENGNGEMDSSEESTVAVASGKVFGIIQWDPGQAMVDKQGNTHSPALILDHEASHAYHYLTNPMEFYRDANDNAQEKWGAMDNAEENNAVNHTNTTSRRLNNGDGGFGGRTDHKSTKLYRLEFGAGSTSRDGMVIPKSTFPSDNTRVEPIMFK